MEDKQKICNLLCETLKATRNQDDLMSIEYKKEPNGEETAVLTYINNSKRSINVSMDSGTAMIRDIMKNID